MGRRVRQNPPSELKAKRPTSNQNPRRNNIDNVTCSNSSISDRGRPSTTGTTALSESYRPTIRGGATTRTGRTNSHAAKTGPEKQYLVRGKEFSRKERRKESTKQGGCHRAERDARWPPKPGFNERERENF